MPDKIDRHDSDGGNPLEYAIRLFRSSERNYPVEFSELPPVQIVKGAWDLGKAGGKLIAALGVIADNHATMALDAASERGATILRLNRYIAALREIKQTDHQYAYHFLSEIKQIGNQKKKLLYAGAAVAFLDSEFNNAVAEMASLQKTVVSLRLSGASKEAVARQP